MTVEEVLNDRLVLYPFTRAMCAPMGDGAAAAILVSAEYLKRLKDARPVKVRASVLASGSTKPAATMGRWMSASASTPRQRTSTS